MGTRTVLLVLSFILALNTLSAQAAPLRVTFVGSVRFVPNGLAPAFSVGDPASGYYSIDSNTSDSDSNTAVGLYLGPINFSFQFGSYAAAAAGGSSGDSLHIFNDSPSGDRYAVNAINPAGADVNGYFLVNLFLDLTDSTGNVFSDDSLPASLSIADFDFSQAQFIFQHPTLTSASILADLTSISVTPVPIPTTFLLLGSGLIGLLGFGRRFRK